MNFLQEAVAAKECLTSHIPTLQNLSDLLTKVLFGQKRRNIVQGIMYDNNNHDRNYRALKLVKHVRWTFDWFEWYLTVTNYKLDICNTNLKGLWKSCFRYTLVMLPLCFRTQEVQIVSLRTETRAYCWRAQAHAIFANVQIMMWYLTIIYLITL